jgi:hypothetical protein
MTKGRAATADRLTQLSAVSRKAWRRFNLIGCPRELNTHSPPRKAAQADEIVKVIQSADPAIASVIAGASMETPITDTRMPMMNRIGWNAVKTLRRLLPVDGALWPHDEPAASA